MFALVTPTLLEGRSIQCRALQPRRRSRSVANHSLELQERRPSWLTYNSLGRTGFILTTFQPWTYLLEKPLPHYPLPHHSSAPHHPTLQQVHRSLKVAFKNAVYRDQLWRRLSTIDHLGRLCSQRGQRLFHNHRIFNWFHWSRRHLRPLLPHVSSISAPRRLHR
ncbi:hypothetical protein BDQ12DRAFT_102362 [Crucibulum laeve]|uniref:Uncharacterized protein n=1 Tax=Crucibulum laeve TaxID=68775 RepID=A0A5C3M0B3_9AGAR|nr:hypothetical protein BDQ12DRAFT_102362 [Crucibulum laeve]